MRGNTNVTLKLNFITDANGFIGGSNPLFNYYLENVSGNFNICNATNETGEQFDVHRIIDEGEDSVCGVFFFNNSRDEFEFNVHVRIPADSFTGHLNTSFNFTAYRTTQ